MQPACCPCRLTGDARLLLYISIYRCAARPTYLWQVLKSPAVIRVAIKNKAVLQAAIADPNGEGPVESCSAPPPPPSWAAPPAPGTGATTISRLPMRDAFCCSARTVALMFFQQGSGAAIMWRGPSDFLSSWCAPTVIAAAAADRDVVDAALQNPGVLDEVNCLLGRGVRGSGAQGTGRRG